MTICPNCKQQVPINELDEHMRSKSPPQRCETEKQQLLTST